MPIHNHRLSACGAFAAVALVLAGPALAQENHAPVCQAKTLAITEPATVAAIIEVNPILIGPACSDADGDTLSLTAVSSPATLVTDKQGHSRDRLRLANTLSLNSSMTVNFTVSDGKGGTETGSVTFVRRDASN